MIAAQNLGSHHRSEADRERYIREFRTRPLLPTLKFFPEGFIKYGIPIFDSLFDIGWSSFVPTSPNPHCPEPVRLFYSNLRLTCSHPLQLQTLVYDTLITVTPALISFVLGAPLVGLTVHNDEQLAAARFDVGAALRALHYDQDSTLPPFHTGRLSPHLRTIHFLITRQFLPRSHNLTILTSIDIWILYHATITQFPLSLPHLMLQALHDASLSSHTGPLPFASFITSLLLKVGVDMQFKVWDTSIYPLRAQSVLRKLNIPNAPQRPKPDISKGGAKGISYCCTDGEICAKLSLLALTIKAGGDWNIAEEQALKNTLPHTIQDFVSFLKRRGDWDLLTIAHANLGKSKKAKEVKELIIKLATKESERNDCSDYESDPEIDF
ncbi:hypothetical protein LINPERPRIM_LOCUS33665 [Linum perenne]